MFHNQAARRLKNFQIPLFLFFFAFLTAPGICPQLAQAVEVPFGEGKVIPESETSRYAKDSGISVKARADMDSDGDIDILGSTKNDDSVYTLAWFENTNGDASAWTTHTIKSDYGGISLSVRDIDGDGDLDVLGVSKPNIEIKWWENVSSGGTNWIEHNIYKEDESIFVKLDFLYFISYPADMDSDGDLDIVLYLNARHDTDIRYRQSDSIYVKWVEQDGNSWKEHLVSDDILFYFIAPPADMDGDGALDIIGEAVEGAYLWKNIGGKGLVWEYEFSGKISHVTIDNLFIVDMDGDEDLDVLRVGDDVMGGIAWLENTNTHIDNWIDHEILDNWAPYNAYPLDIDRDGDMDMTITWSSTWMEILENPNGRGTDWIRYQIHDLNFAYAQFKDFDGDGDLDLIKGGMWWENLLTPFLLGSPRDSEVWTRGTTEEIVWNTFGGEESVSSVTIELFHGDNFLQSIATTAPNNGSFIWTIPAELETGSDYRIRIASVDDPSVFGESGAFSISGLTISGHVRTADGSPVEDVVFFGGRGGVETVTTDGEGFYSVEVPGDWSGSLTPSKGLHFFEPASRAYANVLTSLTDQDFIATPETVSLTSPNGGEAWALGTTRTISWSVEGAVYPNVTLELVKAETLDLVIAESTPNDGSFEWRIPLDLEKGIQYRVKIIVLGIPAAPRDASDGDFSIVAAPPLLGEIADAGDGGISLDWENDGEEPAQFLGVAWDVYRGYWVERGWNDTLWYNFSSSSRAGEMDIGRTGAYHVWVAGHHWDGSVAFCENPWTGIVYDGKPHRPVDVVAAEADGLEISLNWKPEIYGTFVYWFIAYDRDNKEWAETLGPLGESLWHYVDYGSESFMNGSTHLTLPEPNRYWILMAAMAWDAETWSDFTPVKSP